MRKLLAKKNLEKGQVIPLVVLMLFVIIGMVALILDGGAVLSYRRTAQAAADAGALAGAQHACYGLPDPQGVAESYAINNGATSAVATVIGNQVGVVATVEQPSFFAKIFGEETLTADADAIAGCYGAKGKGVVPLAWRCIPNDEGGPFYEDYGCQMQTLSWPYIEPLVSGDVNTLEIFNWNNTTSRLYQMSETSIIDDNDADEFEIPPEQIYIVMKSDKICFEDSGDPNDITCDLDGDGKKDIQTGGDRGFLYLTADTTNIADWVDGGPHPESYLRPHVWLSGKSGGEIDVYIKMNNTGFEGEVVLIPIYNVLCMGDPRTTEWEDSGMFCVDAAHQDPPWSYGEDNFDEMKNQVPYYHIIVFAPFYVSCVDKNGDCPGFKYAKQLNPDEYPPNEEKIAIVEGFFLSDYDVSPDVNQICDINLGNCIISLSD